MTTCFIFADYLNEEGSLSVCLTEQGTLEAPLAQRCFSELKALQANAMTVLVVSSKHASLHRLELPWLPEKKARLAIPYALEDNVAESVDNLHFAFDKQHYHQGNYLVAVCNKQWLMDISSQLQNNAIVINQITLDWFALNDNEIAIMPDGILMNHADYFQGALSFELAALCFPRISNEPQIYGFTDSKPLEITLPYQPIDASSSLWIAQRLQKNQPLNLMQGSLQNNQQSAKNKIWYGIAITISTLWLFSLLIGNGIKIHQLNQQIKETDNQIAMVYREFFPNATQIISPKFRISQFIKSHKNDNDSGLWMLLNQLAPAVKQYHASLEQLRFEHQILQVTLLNTNFDTLDALETYLQTAGLKVKQTQASSRDTKVIATLELSL